MPKALYNAEETALEALVKAVADVLVADNDGSVPDEAIDNDVAQYAQDFESMLRGELEDRGALEEEEYEDDGQPDEAQEWHDFDPDC